MGWHDVAARLRGQAVADVGRVVARFELPAATCVLAHVRLNMVAVLPDASR